MKKITLTLIIILSFYSICNADQCSDEALQQLDEHLQEGINKAVYEEDRDKSIAIIELWETDDFEKKIITDAKCKNTRLSECHQMIDVKMYKYKITGEKITSEIREKMYWRCSKK